MFFTGKTMFRESMPSLRTTFNTVWKCRFKPIHIKAILKEANYLPPDSRLQGRQCVLHRFLHHQRSSEQARGMCARASVGQTARENSIWPQSRGGLWTQLHQFTARLTSLEPTPLSQLSVKLYLGKSFSRWQQNQHKSKLGTPDSRAGLDLAAWDTPCLAEGLWADCAPLSPCFLPCSASPICSDISLSEDVLCHSLCS